MSHGQATAERDDPKILMIVAVALFALVLLVGIVVGIRELYEFAMRDEVARLETTPMDARLVQLRATEKRLLTGYQWVDRQSGFLRIPVDRAVDLTLREFKTRPGGTVPHPVAAGAPAEAAPVPAPEPVGGNLPRLPTRTK